MSDAAPPVIAEYWDAAAPAFDGEAGHGLRKEAARAAWPRRAGAEQLAAAVRPLVSELRVEPLGGEAELWGGRAVGRPGGRRAVRAGGAPLRGPQGIRLTGAARRRRR
ncbi:hypothetical protein [Kitasatospora brasiliensis]|uniref:hypothetical protein n=1 Tax=Kitasatospora brasiliensis TaxID=3058040 RepID=UPI002930F010|nr:hypothetical protein [Kitasatospora sp. K002]